MKYRSYERIQNSQIPAVINFLKDSESDASRMAKKENCDNWRALSSRLNFLHLLLSILSTLTNIDDSMKGEAEKLNVQITQSQSLLKIIHQTTHLGNKKVTHSDNVELPLVRES